MDRTTVAEVLAKPVAQELLASSIPARLAYVGLDGDPRVVPVGFHWTGSALVIGTIPTSAKVPALRRHPRVAITVDTDGFPPHVLLVRGAATLEEVDGVPDEYIAAARKLVPAPEFAGWEAGVRALYRSMVLVTIEPDHATLLDFETTIPRAVAELITAHGDPR